jgi:hypothetical protein
VTLESNEINATACGAGDSIKPSMKRSEPQVRVSSNDEPAKAGGRVMILNRQFIHTTLNAALPLTPAFAGSQSCFNLSWGSRPRLYAVACSAG